MNTPLNKRFWTEVSVAREDDGFAVLLDGRPLKTPAKAALLAPNEALAQAIAEEWQAVEEKIDPRKMHLTRCANATIDKVFNEHASVAAMLAEYGATDLLCYRAESPATLAQRQQDAWDPLLEWLEKTHGVELKTTAGVMHIPQSEAGQAKLRELVLAFDPWRMTALHDLVTISGSLVLALAVAERYLSPPEAWKIAQIDEAWQEEQWGVDDESRAAAELKYGDFLKAARLLDLLSGANPETTN